MKVKVYVEGGGDSNALRTLCRSGFRRLFESAGLTGRMPAVVACGSRQDAFDSFCTAVNKAGPRDVPVLLVDSEATVTKAPWSHLQTLDGWQQPSRAEDDQAHLMVQCMESWFLVDPATLAAYFGKGFNASAIPANQHVESISKQRVSQFLKAATRTTVTKGTYSKARHSFEILGMLDVSLLQNTCPHAKRLFEFLENLLVT